jgi:(2R)-ethylmalonyl-CoA mutase
LAARAYVALADEQGVARNTLQGTTQNAYHQGISSRGTHVFRRHPRCGLTKDTIPCYDARCRNGIR